MNLTVLRAKKQLEDDVDLELNLTIENIENDGSVPGHQGLEKRWVTAYTERLSNGELWYFVLDEETIEALYHAIHPKKCPNCGGTNLRNEGFAPTDTKSLICKTCDYLV